MTREASCDVTIAFKKEFLEANFETLSAGKNVDVRDIARRRCCLEFAFLFNLLPSSFPSPPPPRWEQQTMRVKVSLLASSTCLASVWWMR